MTIFKKYAAWPDLSFFLNLNELASVKSYSKLLFCPILHYYRTRYSMYFQDRFLVNIKKFSLFEMNNKLFFFLLDPRPSQYLQSACFRTKPSAWPSSSPWLARCWSSTRRLFSIFSRQNLSRCKVGFSSLSLLECWS